MLYDQSYRQGLLSQSRCSAVKEAYPFSRTGQVWVQFISFSRFGERDHEREDAGR